MAVPARKTSKAKKNKHRTHYGVKAPAISFDGTTGTFKRSHHVSLAEYKAQHPIEKN
ncbi:50S ribosomal protein L32 [Enterococcus casseliflavus]|uniref:50S ribosomal protein L32 n=1 Tax=Enterococcus casseliflavus TaxID=37734 RepID=UPI003DA5CB5F